MIRSMRAPHWGGRALILVGVLAVCAALIPSQSYAARVKPTELTVSNEFSVATCAASVVGVDIVPGYTTYKVTATARSIGSNASKNDYTEVTCHFSEGPKPEGWNFGPILQVVGTKRVNETETLHEMTEPLFLCAHVYTAQKNDYIGSHSPITDCVALP